MTEVRISSLCERPCAGIEETGEAPSDAGGMECSRRRKVHSLIDKVYDPTNLAEAWKRVRENKGSAGIDGLTVAGFEQRQDELLETLHKQLREKTYRPSPVKRVVIPKLGGGTRNLGIPSVRDRVVQQALVQKMTPIFEPLFADCSFGYRPGRSPHMAMRKVWREIQEGNFWILDADLRAYFDLDFGAFGEVKRRRTSALPDAAPRAWDFQRFVRVRAKLDNRPARGSGSSPPPPTAPV